MAIDARIGPSDEAPAGFFTETHRSLARVLLAVVWTRAVLWAVVDYAVHAHPPRFHASALREFGSSAFAALLRWDVWWYVSIARSGYEFDPHRASNAAFLPGFPAFIALFTPAFGNAALAGMFVANTAFVLTVVAFWAWVRDRSGVRVAERAAVLLIVYPFSFFLNTAYAESIYFLWCTLALRATDREEWGSAALFASLATLTRPMGLFLVPAFVWRLARSKGGRTGFAALLPILAPPLALFGFALYQWTRVGSPFALWVAQRVGWGVGDHFSVFKLPERAELARQLADVFHVLVPVPLLWLSVRALRRLGPVAGVYSIVTIVVAICLGGDSLGREALAAVPLFAVGGLAKLGPRSVLALQSASFALFIVFACAFCLGVFMG